jgi:hypothetical protein
MKAIALKVYHSSPLAKRFLPPHHSWRQKGPIVGRTGPWKQSRSKKGVGRQVTRTLDKKD